MAPTARSTPACSPSGSGWRSSRTSSMGCGRSARKRAGARCCPRRCPSSSFRIVTAGGGELPPILKETLVETAKIRVRPKRYGAALRDWAANGPASSFALSPEEVVARSRPRPPEASEAAAHFELGQHLLRAGHLDDAREHFRAAHRLDPGNWTYKRQAWSIE